VAHRRGDVEHAPSDTWLIKASGRVGRGHCGTLAQAAGARTPTLDTLRQLLCDGAATFRTTY
jgi:hypothetical protein